MTDIVITFCAAKVRRKIYLKKDTPKFFFEKKIGLTADPSESLKRVKDLKR